MKRGTAAKVILGKDTLMDVPAGIVFGTDVILGGKAGLINDFNGLVLSNNVLLGKKISHSTIISVIVRGQSPLILPDAIADSLSYVKAFGGTEQRDIPDNYLQRQFIYMMDGSYIKVEDLLISAGYRVEFEFQTLTLASPLRNFIGGRANGVSAGGGFRLSKLAAGGTTLNRVVLYGFESGTEYYDPTVQFQPATRYKYTYNNGVCTLESGGSVISTRTFTVTDDTSTKWGINSYVSGNDYWQTDTSGIYVYSVKIWNDQGDLVMDLVPAVQKGQTMVVGFYDRVTGGFRTPSAGIFAAGPEAAPTPDKPMDIVSNNGVLKVRHQSGLPLGYTLLEYIESTGTQYIDTGITDITDSEFILDAKLSEIYGGSFSTMLGASVSSVSMYKIPIGVTSTLRFYTQVGAGGAGYTYATSADTSRHTFKITTGATAGGVLSVDNNDVSFSYSLQGDTTLSLYLFARNNSGSANNFISMACYGLVVKKSGALVRNLVPCKRNSDNVLGMYDTVSGTFFTNAGTGDFVAGNQVNDLEGYTDGTVETINVHGKNLFDQSTATRYRTSWSNSGDGAWQAVSSSSEAVTYGSYVKPNTTYTLSKKGGSRLTITGYRTKTEPSSSAIPADYQIQVNTTEIVDGSYTFTTPTDCTWILFGLRQNNSTPTFPYDVQLEQGATATAYVPYYDGGTATAEMLLKVGDYQDVQSIIDGAVTRNVGVKVLDGTENWTWNASSGWRARLNIQTVETATSSMPALLCNMFTASSWSGVSATAPNISINSTGTTINFTVGWDANITSLAAWQQWLASQYTAGTPVIVIYPLATPTTESVTGQTLQVTDGDNVLEITQASLNNLELEAQYNTQVQLTVQEVESANLDNDVTVTII